MEAFITFLCCIVALVLDFIMAKKMCGVVEIKGHDANKLNIFIWCFLFPIFGYAYVIALPNFRQHDEIMAYIKRDNAKEEKENNDDVSWTCKKCGLKNPSTRMTCQKCDTYKNEHLIEKYDVK